MTEYWLNTASFGYRNTNCFNAEIPAQLDLDETSGGFVSRRFIGCGLLHTATNLSATKLKLLVCHSSYLQNTRRILLCKLCKHYQPNVSKSSAYLIRFFKV